LAEIEQLEKQGYVDLFYADASGFCLTPVMSYCWQYPNERVYLIPQFSKRINVFGLFSKDNRFTGFQTLNRMDTAFVIESIENWRQTLTKPTVLVLDNSPIHQAKAFWQKIDDWQEQGLFIFFLPAYSPHLNKIEILWRKIKYEWLKPSAYSSFASLKEAIEQILAKIGTDYTITFT
jgi:transposase